jgi:hypothetical protein
MEGRPYIDHRRAPAAKAFTVAFFVAFLCAPLLRLLAGVDGEPSGAVDASIYMLGLLLFLAAMVSFAFALKDPRARRFGLGGLVVLLLIALPTFVEAIRELTGW